MTHICIPIIENNMLDALAAIHSAEDAGADILEIWLGEIDNMVLEDLRNATMLPLVANCKNHREKGNFPGTDTRKVLILAAAAKMGFEYVDVDFEISPDLLSHLLYYKPESCSLILSAHFFDRTPNIHSLMRVFVDMKERNADVIKIAAMPRNLKDTIMMMRFAEKCIEKKRRHIIISMGEVGKMTRLFSPLLQNEMMFATVAEKKNDLGQYSAAELHAAWGRNLKQNVGVTRRASV